MIFLRLNYVGLGERKLLKRTVSGIMLTLILLTVTTLVLHIQTIQAHPEPEVFSDDFSTDSGMWEYLGSAYRDPVNNYLVLTEPVNDRAGVAFFNTTFRTYFTANFSYKAGGGSGADGFVMFFYKQKYASFGYGGTLGFNGPTQIPGYGIEFDNWQNIAQGEPSPPKEHGDPSPNHIALIKDHVGNHLIYVDDLRTEDNIWHDVSVEVEESSVRVFLDQGLVLEWSGVINRTFDYFGFCAGTGSATNWHIIDNFSIKIHTPTTPIVAATVDVNPNTLNLRSRGKWITAYIELPEGYDVADINVSSILLNGTVPAEMCPTCVGDYDEDGIPDLMVKFDRTQVISYILASVNLAQLVEQKFMTTTLTISGKLNDGTLLQGTDTIRIIMPKYLILLE
jgi:hypothetical protein